MSTGHKGQYKKAARGQMKFINSSHLTSFRLNRTAVKRATQFTVAATNRNAVGCAAHKKADSTYSVDHCEMAKTGRHPIRRSQPRQTGSLHSRSVQTKWCQMR